MKINLSKIDEEKFIVKSASFYDEPAVLATPQHIGVKWTQQNKIFRSSIWRQFDSELVSAGFPKFVNAYENPEEFPLPSSLDGTQCRVKVDGSLLICDWSYGQFNMRTRGTSSYQSLENNGDFEYVSKKYDLPKITSDLNLVNKCSVLFEIVSPNQKIVIDYGDEPDIYLIGIVYHNDYSLMAQDKLDFIASRYNLKRPEKAIFSSIEGIIESLKDNKEIEGYCLYSRNFQEIWKFKAPFYLKLHSFKFQLNLEKCLDVFLSSGVETYQGFVEYLGNYYDWECIEFCRSYVSKIFDAKKEVDKILNHLIKFVQPLKSLSRKEAALKILSAYGKTTKASFGFMLLDDQELTEKELKKLYLQILTKK